MIHDHVFNKVSLDWSCAFSSSSKKDELMMLEFVIVNNSSAELNLHKRRIFIQSLGKEEPEEEIHMDYDDSVQIAPGERYLFNLTCSPTAKRSLAFCEVVLKERFYDLEYTICSPQIFLEPRFLLN